MKPLPNTTDAAIAQAFREMRSAYIGPEGIESFCEAIDHRAAELSTETPATAHGGSAAAVGGAYVPGDGEVLVTVSGLTGSGKSGIAGEIEILCKALGLQVEWKDSEEEKFLTHADWTEALELYKPRVTIIEQNIPRKP